jgi:penicillin V acylase-like amidase (Ntn superfamily)
MKILMLIFSLLIFSDIQACSRLFWNENSQAKIVGRSMDLFISDEPELWVNPRGLSHTSTVDDNGLEWTSLYGSVSISAFRLKEFTTDGMNERGLAVHLLALKETKYEKRDQRPGIHYGHWPQYLLDTCQTVKEALDAHQKFQVVCVPLNQFEWPLHLMIEDASGDSAIVEFANGQMKVYHGTEYQVGTNGPTYDEHWTNLTSYEGFGGLKPLPTGQDSASRFVRAWTHLNQLPEPQDPDEAVTLLREAMGSVRQKDHVVGTNMTVSTLWISVLDLTHRIYYFMPQGQSDVLRVDLSELNFSEDAPVQKINFKP